MSTAELAKELIDIVQRGLADKTSDRVLCRRVAAQLDTHVGTSDDETVLMVKLNCGEPIRLACNNPAINGSPVVFLEDSTMAEEKEACVFVDNDDCIIASVMETEFHSDLSDYMSAADEFEQLES